VAGQSKQIAFALARHRRKIHRALHDRARHLVHDLGGEFVDGKPLSIVDVAIALGLVQALQLAAWICRDDLPPDAFAQHRGKARDVSIRLHYAGGIGERLEPTWIQRPKGESVQERRTSVGDPNCRVGVLADGFIRSRGCSQRGKRLGSSIKQRTTSVSIWGSLPDRHASDSPIGRTSQSAFSTCISLSMSRGHSCEVIAFEGCLCSGH
jgi:hypothetical protein